MNNQFYQDLRDAIADEINISELDIRLTVNGLAILVGTSEHNLARYLNGKTKTPAKLGIQLSVLGQGMDPGWVKEGLPVTAVLGFLRYYAISAREYKGQEQAIAVLSYLEDKNITELFRQMRLEYDEHLLTTKKQKPEKRKEYKVCISLSPVEHEAIKNAAQKLKTSQSEVGRFLIAENLQRLILTGEI